MRNTFPALRARSFSLVLAGLICMGSCYAAETCTMWTDPAEGYSICLPDNWFHSAMPDGSLFLCDQRKGACTEKSGNPSAGHATVSVMPMRDVLGTKRMANAPAAPLADPPASTEEFAHRVADKDRTSAFSGVVTVTNFYAPIRYVLVAQTAVSAEPQTVMRYFVEVKGQMMEFQLTYNIGEHKAQTFQDAVLKMIGSLRPK